MRLRAEVVDLGPLSLHLTLYLGRSWGIRATASLERAGRRRKCSAAATWSGAGGAHLSLETPGCRRCWASGGPKPQEQR